MGMSLDQFKANASVLLQRATLALRAGLQFDGERDLYKVFGYKNDPKFMDYLAKYTRQDIVARVVDAPAAALWRNPPEITGSDSFTKIWDDLNKQYRIWNKLERVDRLCGLGQFAVLLVGFDDGNNPEMPVRGRNGTKILYLQPYSVNAAVVTKSNSDPADERYGKPEEYEITVTDPSVASIAPAATKRATSTTKTILVHYTRVLHVAEGLLEDDVYGVPRLGKIYNLFDDLAKVVGGTAETYWLTANRGLQADVDKEMDLNKDDAKALTDELEEYQHQLRRIIRTRGVTIKPLGSETPNPEPTFNMLIALVSGATGIPRRILLGSEAGQLASEQDRANWAERIEERRNNFGEPLVLDPLIKLLHNAGVLPTDDVAYKWPEAFRMNPLERAMEMAQQARAATNFSKQFPNSQPITTQEEAREMMNLPPGGGPDKLDQAPEPAPELEGPEDDPAEIERERAEQEEDEGRSRKDNVLNMKGQLSG